MVFANLKAALKYGAIPITTAIFSMVFIRLIFPDSGINQLLYLTFALFLFNYVGGLFANVVALKGVCKSEESYQELMKKAATSALAPAIMGAVLGSLMSFIGLKITSNIPKFDKATAGVTMVAGKNLVFGPFLTVIFFTYLGGIIGVYSSLKCKK